MIYSNVNKYRNTHMFILVLNLPSKLGEDYKIISDDGIVLCNKLLMFKN